MRPRIFIALGALIVVAGTASAECGLPPLGGITQTQENPVHVDGHRFGSAWYSYHVESYRVDSLHCSKSINSGPRGWDVIVESGRVIVNSEPQSDNAQGRKANQRASGSVAALPALPALTQSAPALPNVAPMPNVSSLPNIAPMPDVKPIPAAPGRLPVLPPLPAQP